MISKKIQLFGTQEYSLLDIKQTLTYLIQNLRQVDDSISILCSCKCIESNMALVDVTGLLIVP